MSDLLPYLHDLLLFGVIAGLIVDGAGKERMHRLGAFFARIGRDDDLYRVAVEKHRLEVKAWEETCAATEKAWEARCVREQPGKWRRKRKLEEAIAELERKCSSLTSLDVPTHCDSEPFIELKRAERKLFELVEELDPPDTPEEPEPPTSSSIQPIRSSTFVASFIAIAALTWWVLREQAESDGTFPPIQTESELWALAVYIGTQLGSILAVGALFVLASLVSQAVSSFVGYGAAKAAGALGFLLSRPMLHLCLRIAAWLDVAWNVWARFKSH